MITGTVRRDGYSAFGQANPNAVFPSVALGWVFSEESFMDKIEWLEYAKLRVSWGKNGNRSIGEYAALMQLSPRKYFYYDPNTGELIPINTFYCYNMANAGLKWENTESWNLGLDFTVLGGRLGGSIDLYNKKTNDLLNNRQLPSLIGYSSVTSNIGEINNKGIELSLHSTNINKPNLTWRTTLNLSYNKNTIKHLYGIMEDIKDDEGNVIGQKEADDITNGYFIGHALDEIWGYKFIGVWQENEAEEAAKYKQQPGDPKLLDVDNNYKFNNDDKVFQGNTTPKVRWNMRNEFTFFKDLTFSFNIYSKMGHKSLETDYLNKDNAGSKVTNGQNVYAKKGYWTVDNPTNEYGRLDAQGPSGVTTPGKLHNRSFIRLDNISLAYKLPKKFISRWSIEKAIISGSIKNVAVWAKDWKYWDPETGGLAPRTFNIGLTLTL